MNAESSSAFSSLGCLLGGRNVHQPAHIIQRVEGINSIRVMGVVICSDRGRMSTVFYHDTCLSGLMGNTFDRDRNSIEQVMERMTCGFLPLVYRS